MPQGSIRHKPIVPQCLSVTISISHSGELFTHRVRVRVTSGSLGVTIPVCHSRELFMHKVTVNLCHNPDMSQQIALYAQG